MSIFDVVNTLFQTKPVNIDCNNLNNFMLTRILSFHSYNKIKGIAETLNRYTFLQSEDYCKSKLFFYNLAYSLTPKFNKPQYIKYIKKEVKDVNEDIYNALKKEYGEELSIKELKFIYEYLLKVDKDKLINILRVNGLTDKDLYNAKITDKKPSKKKKKATIF